VKFDVKLMRSRTFSTDCKKREGQVASGQKVVEEKFQRLWDVASD